MPLLESLTSILGLGGIGKAGIGGKMYYDSRKHPEKGPTWTPVPDHSVANQLSAKSGSLLAPIETVEKVSTPQSTATHPSNTNDKDHLSSEPVVSLFDPAKPADNVLTTQSTASRSSNANDKDQLTSESTAIITSPDSEEKQEKSNNDATSQTMSLNESENTRIDIPLEKIFTDHLIQLLTARVITALLILAQLEELIRRRDERTKTSQTIGSGFSAKVDSALPSYSTLANMVGAPTLSLVNEIVGIDGNIALQIAFPKANNDFADKSVETIIKEQKIICDALGEFTLLGSFFPDLEKIQGIVRELKDDFRNEITDKLTPKLVIEFAEYVDKLFIYKIIEKGLQQREKSLSTSTTTLFAVPPPANSVAGMSGSNCQPAKR